MNSYSVNVDFDVYKELTYRRESEEEDYNDVLRKLLKLPVKPKESPNGSARPWISERVTFPSGTTIRAKYKGVVHTGSIENGALIVNGKTFSGFSPAAKHVTGHNQNGWKFWECKRPVDADFIPVDQLRRK